MYGEVDAKTTSALTDIAYRVRHVGRFLVAPIVIDGIDRRVLRPICCSFSLAVAAAPAIILKWTPPLISGIWLDWPSGWC